jgi:phosphatidylglycerophosphatase A
MNEKSRKIFLTLFYSGLSPKAPGTVGSFVALIMGMLLLNFFSATNLFLAAILISLFAVKQIDIYEKETKTHDGKEIVIDELAGMWITLGIASATSDNYIIAILAFLYFRLFDIWKPSLIGKIDKNVEGGWGVMGDDLLAGVFAGICTALTFHILSDFI